MTDEGKTTLGGREFRPLVQSTLEHDFWVMDEIHRAGLDQVTLGPGEDAEDFARRLIRRVIASGRAFDLLGGLLIPAELGAVAWSPETARETANHLRTITDPGEKAQVQSFLASLLIGFFQHGLISVGTSARSSEVGPEKNPDDAGTLTSVSGRMPSSAWPAEIPIEPVPLRAGMSGTSSSGSRN